MIESKTSRELLAPCVRDDELPFVFDPSPESWTKFRQDFGGKFGVPAEDLRVVGSGRFGFSTKPNNDLRAFAETSDIDLIVVSAQLFDDLWDKLLAAAYPRDANVHRLGGHLRDLQSELYTGFLTPKEFRLDPKFFGPKASPIVTFRHRWFEALQRASSLPIRRHDRMQARLYRSWVHVDHYHLDSLTALQRSLTN